MRRGEMEEMEAGAVECAVMFDRPYISACDAGDDEDEMLFSAVDDSFGLACSTR